MRTLLLVLFFSFSICLFSQEIKEEDSVKRSKEILTIGILNNSWFYSGDDHGLKAISVGSSVCVMRDLRFKESNFSFAFGAGVYSGNYHNNSSLKVNLDSSYISFNSIPDSINVKTNKLSVVNFNIPLELRYVSKKNSNNRYYKLALGFNVGYLLSGYTKFVGGSYDEDTGEYLGEVKVKTYRIKYLQKFNYGAYLKAGYGKVGVVFAYSFTDLFEENKAPYLRPFSIGLTYIPF